ncbi:hypothetical protein [Gemmatirosa kalamazoonensis]|uniref:hypothetical protein n=1 Tax=Gemmatirosa kalamazoonensis TaxID=861299 RepID=UPI0011DD50D6|nr:hypothetical protein [Gemmatirosa kalamazoonensis]
MRRFLIFLGGAVVVASCGDTPRTAATTADGATTAATPSAAALTDACEAIAGGAPAVDSSSEATALQALTGWRRDGVTLRYTAPRGASLALVDDSADDEGYVSHQLVGRLAGTEYAAVSRTRYEALDYLLVHLPTGDTLGVRDLPVPSPDGHYAAAAKADLEADFEDSGLDVIALTPDGARLDYTLTTSGTEGAESWAPVHVRWVGAELAYGHAVPVDGAPGRCRVTPERLVRTSSGWEIRRDGH